MFRRSRYKVTNLPTLEQENKPSFIEIETNYEKKEELSVNFKENILFTSHDHQFVQTIANRIIEFNETGILDRLSTYDEYLEYKENNK